MGTVKLKNGRMEEENSVNFTMLVIQKAFNEQTDDIMRLGVTDVLMGLEDSNYRTSDEMKRYMAQFGLMKKKTDGEYQMDNVVRNVFVSCFAMDGFAATMVSPIEGDNSRNFGYNKPRAL